MGANSRTYKFALGHALLLHARTGQDEIPLRDFAQTYVAALVNRDGDVAQSPASRELGKQDFLQIVKDETPETVMLGRPTDKLVDAAVRNMPGMVLQKFHNLAGGVQLPDRFYELDGHGDDRRVVLTPAMQQVADHRDNQVLEGELEARWRIVENSFAAGVGRSLLTEGVEVDLGTGFVTDKRRRRSLTGVHQAVAGFQYGRCHICNEPIGPDEPAAVDHVFPFSLNSRGVALAWADLDLDAIWNLASTHSVCNSRKSNRPPTVGEVRRLAHRNAAIMRSPHPLRRSLELILRARGYAGRPDDWYAFLQRILAN